MQISASSAAIAGLTTLMTLVSGAIAPSSAQVCEPLPVVDGDGQTEVTKTVSPPGTLLLDTNWNTDFVVASAYDRFVVNFTSAAGDSYDVDVHLKYADGSTEMPYSARDARFPVGETTEIAVVPETNAQPYQLNLRVGGFDAESNTYTASVLGCR